MPKKIILIGAGGHSKVIQDILLDSGKEIFGILDDNVSDKNILGKLSDVEKYKEDYQFIIAIGNNEVRKKIAIKYKLDYAIIIHPRAIISKDVIIEEGTVIMAGAIINTGTKIGKHCIINTGAIVEHNNLLENYVHISPGGILAGTVFVGELSWIGAGATVINNIKILKKAIVGAGSVVIQDIPSNSIAVGVPTKILKVDNK